MSLALTALPATAQEAPLEAGTEIAFFGITFLDESLQTQMLGEDPDEIARVAMLEDLVRERFTENGLELIDTAPVAEDIDRVVNPAKCYGCDTRAAAELGADYSLVGEVQKVSNLILSMNLQLRDAQTGETVRGRVVDIRANTDDAWRRGMASILENAFFN